MKVLYTVHVSYVIIILLIFLEQSRCKPSLAPSSSPKSSSRRLSSSTSASPLIKKLESLEHYRHTTVKQFRSGGSISRYSQNRFNDLSNSLSKEIHSIEEEEAIVMQYTMSYVLDAFDISLKRFPRMIRICTDTIVNSFSGVMMGIGGLLNLFANSFSFLSFKLNDAQRRYELDLPTEEYWKLKRYSKEYYQNQSHSIAEFSRLNNNGTNNTVVYLPPAIPPKKLPNYLIYRINKLLMKAHTIKGLKNTAMVLYGFREACVFTAEVIEALTLGLGEGLESSFQSIQFLSTVGHYLVDNLLMSDDPSDQTYHDYILLKQKQNESVLNAASSAEKGKHDRSIDSLPTFVVPEEERGYSSSKEFSSNKDSSHVNSSSYNESKEGESSHSAAAAAGSRRVLIRPNKSFDPKDEFVDHSDRQPERDQSREIGTIYFFINQLNELEVQLYYRFFEFLLFLSDQVTSWSQIFLQQAYQSVAIMKHSLEIPSISMHLILSFIVILVLASLPLQRRIRLPLLTFTMIGLWAMIIMMEYTQRYRLIQRIQIESLETYLHDEIRWTTTTTPTNPSPPTTSSHDNTTSTTTTTAPTTSFDRNSILHQLRQEYIPIYSQSHTDPSPHHHHHLIWLNTLFASLWNIMDHEFYNSGLGLYMSEIYELMLIDALDQIHVKTSGFIHDIKLKKFHFGINPPLIKQINTMMIRDHQCVQQLLQDSLYQHQEEKQRSHTRRQKKKNNNNGMSGFFSSASSSSRPSSTRKRSYDLLQEYLQLNTTSLLLTEEQQDYLMNLSEQVSEFIMENLLKFHSTFSFSSSSSSSSSSFEGEEDTMNHDTTSSNSSSSSSSPSSSHASRKRKKDESMQLNHFFVDCDLLVMDVDMIYVSKDMNIILSLRTNEIKSMLPEFSTTVSEVVFEGKLRFKTKLSNDYPFFGNATMAFIEPPILDFTVNSFGGLDLSSIPYVFPFINSSLYSILDEITEPKYIDLDLRHIVCPSCDQLQTKIFSFQDIWTDSIHYFDYFFTHFWSNLKEKTNKTIMKMKAFIGKYVDKVRQLRDIRKKEREQQQQQPSSSSSTLQPSFLQKKQKKASSIKKPFQKHEYDALFDEDIL